MQPAPAWQWSVAFCGTFLLLLPATAAMGATLPAMERLTAQLRARRAVHRGALRQQHVRRGARRARRRVLAGPRARPGAHRGRLRRAQPALRRDRAGRVSRRPRQTAPRAAAPDRARARGVLSRLAVTGLLGIGYEVLVVRVLSQVTENTVYTFAMLLAVYLVGTAAGAAGYQRWLRRPPRSRTQLRRPAARRAGGGLPGRHGVAVGRRAREGAGAATRSAPAWRAALAAEAVLALRRLRAADDRDGRAVQPPEPRARAPPASASGARSASTRWARRSRRRSSACWWFRRSGPSSRCC